MSLKSQIQNELVFLQNVTGEGSSNLSDEIQELRSMTMVIHLNIESLLENLIGSYLDEPFKIGKNHIEITQMATNFARHHIRIESLITDMDFVKKLNFLEKVEMITKESKVKGKIMIVNDLRVIFSHPLSHKNKIDLLKKEENYLSAIKSLGEGFNAINNYYDEIMFGIERG